MKDNYLSWQIDFDAFPKNATLREQFGFFLRFAVLAPSSHNSQPWRFTIEKDGILVLENLKRRLGTSDQNGRQLFISLGCAITNILVAADYYGFIPRVDYLLDSENLERVAKIFLTKIVSRTDKKDHLIFSIPERTTNRNKYEDRLPPEGFLKQIESFTATDLHIDIIKNWRQKDAIASAALAGMAEAMADKAFRNELSQYVRSNITKSSIGIPGFGMGLHMVTSLIAPKLLKYFDMSKTTRRQDEQLLKRFTPILVIISTEDDNKVCWLKAGQVYEQIALLAEKEGIKTAIWAAPVQIGDHYKTLQGILKTGFRPQVFFRMGYTDKITPHSPRASVLEVIINE